MIEQYFREGNHLALMNTISHTRQQNLYINLDIISESEYLFNFSIQIQALFDGMAL